ncbi:uncharacterized protein LOC126604265 isoform X2 [Malus sylvestris]|uniref:uncharacterized protein LOC126604265 isoform X2 n=1 Tax=Malus sylvestris TaxID=3752 RepID=UPI0021ACDB37|nr:uncharacterized protein LOC126604265 isoform X2 [Malus sylvestris]
MYRKRPKLISSNNLNYHFKFALVEWHSCNLVATSDYTSAIRISRRLAASQSQWRRRRRRRRPSSPPGTSLLDVLLPPRRQRQVVSSSPRIARPIVQQQQEAEVAILCEDCDGIGPRPIESTFDGHLAELLVRCCVQSARHSNVSHSQITMMVRRCLFKPPISCIKDAAPEISSLILSSANT